MTDGCLNKTIVHEWEKHAAAIRKEIGNAKLSAVYAMNSDTFQGWVICTRRGGVEVPISSVFDNDEDAWRDAAERLGVI